jgi:hypothetical protein
MSSEEQKKQMRFLAACEQASASMRNVATMVSAYFIALTESGLDREEALTLTIAYQNFIFGLAKMDNLE